MHRLATPLALSLVTSTALALVGCTSSATTSRVIDLVGGETAVEILAAPSANVSREAFRIDGMAFMKGTAKDATHTVQGFPVLAGPVTVDDASAALLADVLLSDDTYLWDLAKGCEFLPGVAIRQTRDGTTVDVLVCFSCDEVEIFVNGEKAGHEDVVPRRPDLVRIAQTLFPDDPKIQGLR